MKHPFILLALKQAGRNQRLQRANVELTQALEIANGTTEDAQRLVRQVAAERDEAYELVTNLRIDVACLEQQVRVLMEACPIDARDLADG